MTWARLLDDEQDQARQIAADLGPLEEDSPIVTALVAMKGLIEARKLYGRDDDYEPEWIEVFEMFGHDVEDRKLEPLETMLSAAEQIVLGAVEFREAVGKEMGAFIGQGSTIRLGNALYSWRVQKKDKFRDEHRSEFWRTLVGLEGDGPIPDNLKPIVRIVNEKYVRRGELREVLSELQDEGVIPKDTKVDRLLEEWYEFTYDPEPSLTVQPVDHVRAPKYGAKMDHGEIRIGKRGACPDCEGVVGRDRGCPLCKGTGLAKIEE